MTDQAQPKKVETIDAAPAAIEHLDFNQTLPCDGPLCRQSPMPRPAKFMMQALVHYLLPPSDVGIISPCCQECWDWMGQIDMLACGGCGAILGPRDDVFKIVEVLK